MEFKEISKGINIGFEDGGRFKTSALSVSFCLTPDRHDLAANALAFYLMRTGCNKYPTDRALEMKLGELYGADIDVSVQKLGDRFKYSITLYCLKTEFTDCENLTEQALGLLFDLIFEKYSKEDGCINRNFEREKRLLTEKIKSEINEKRIYATNKMIAEMCENEPYGAGTYGSLADAEALNKDDVYAAIRRLLGESLVNVICLGADSPEKVTESVKNAFAKIDRNYLPLAPEIVKKANSTKRILENMDITQSKLVMGFRSETAGDDRETAAQFVMCDVFGGGPHSKLFTIVREKMSLCYYCSAALRRRKGIMIVSSGVETQNVEKAEKAILEQFQATQKGEISSEDLAKSKRYLTGNIKSVEDEVSMLIEWYSLRAAYSSDVPSPSKVCEYIESVTIDDVKKAASGFALDTVFALSPKEEK